MDFFDHQERARRNSFRLVIYFILAVIAVVLSVYLAAIGILLLVDARQDQPQHLGLWQPELFAIVTFFTLLIIVSGSLYKIWTIGGSGENVAVALGGRQVPANTRDLSERVLLNVVEEMALASGTPVPPVYLMQEEGINAFAAGTTPQNAVIGITRGAIDTLSRDELQGVIAHEFSHILNGDMRINIRLMGWLHGILVIAMIGYVILRTMGSTSSSSSRSSSGNKKGDGGAALAILAAAIALIVIGYVGVFFAQLIKAALSRQREFLADASAVQFTRNPSGIANALKKIGGWQAQSKIEAPQAQESSHMFFGSAVTANLFATHPPLQERIQRIEPQFDGSFPDTRPISHSLSEIVDPSSLAQQISGFSAAHTAAVGGVKRMQTQPGSLLESVGEPREKHIEHVHGLVDNLEPPLSEDVRDPLGAVAIVYALLLAPSGSPMRAQQLEQLRSAADARVMAEFGRVVSAVDRLAPEQRLPVACLALPSLHQMSPPQVNDFEQIVRELIRMDSQVTLFEFAVQRFIAKRLAARLGNARQRPAGQRAFSELQSAFTVVLSTLANIGSPNNAERAFAAGLQTLQRSSQRSLPGITLLPAEACNVKNLDRALDELASSSPKNKKHMLASFTACITADAQIAVEEGELLRVIADALGCPVPPILPV